MVGADAGGDVRVQLAPAHARRVAVDVLGERELLELARVARDDAGEVHHLGQADHAAASQQRVEVAGRQLAPRRLEAATRARTTRP